MKPKVLVTGPLHASGLDLLRAAVLIEGDVEKPMRREDVLSMLSGKDGLVVASPLKVDAALMDLARELKVVSTNSVGYDHIDVAEATRRGIYVCNTPGVLTDCVAETTWALILAVAKRLVEGDRFVRSGRWDRPLTSVEFLGSDLRGKTLGIIGLGRIGKRVAEVARCFGLRVLYYDTVRSELHERMGVVYRELSELLKEADIVTLHVPLKSDTYHMVDASKIYMMKKGAILINTSRGAVVDERVLVEALRDGRIAAAGLDVFEEEPISKESELVKLENVVLSPHRGSASVETRMAMAELVARNLISVLKGVMPPALVNPEVLNVRSLEEVKML